MIQRDDLPPTPDWVGCAGNRDCRNCTLSTNFCNCSQFMQGEKCCGSCDHRPEVEPLLYEGDQA